MKKSSFQIIFYLNLQLSKFTYLKHIFCLIFKKKCAYSREFPLNNVREEKKFLFKEMRLFKVFSYKKCKGRTNLLFKSFIIWIFNYLNFLILNTFFVSFFQKNAPNQGNFLQKMQGKNKSSFQIIFYQNLQLSIFYINNAFFVSFF